MNFSSTIWRRSVVMAVVCFPLAHARAAEEKDEAKTEIEKPDTKAASGYKSAVIVPVSEDEDRGDVELELLDGSKVSATKDKGASMPKVSEDGKWAGWTWGKESYQPDEHHGALWVNTKLVVVSDAGATTLAFEAEKPFIEDWAFSADATCVVVISRGYRGPAAIQRFFLDGKTEAERIDAFQPDPPEWAKPFSEAE